MTRTVLVAELLREPAARVVVTRRGTEVVARSADAPASVDLDTSC